MDYRIEFSKRLIQLREQRGITQQELADKLKITRQSLSLYEKAERTINIELLARIADFFNVSTDYLMGRTDTATMNEDIQTACKITGLSEEAINKFAKILNIIINGGILIVKEEFLMLLKSINREGMDELINFIERSDFFKAPASTRFHGSYEGGLLEHSLNVYKILSEKVKNCPIELNVSQDSIIIMSLLHDICKANFYKVDYRNAKNDLGVWEKVPYYTIDDTIPYGHGEKSVMMISEYIKLTVEEKYAIRWHMGFTEPKEMYSTIGQAYKKYPIALLLHEADLETTYFYDV